MKKYIENLKIIYRQMKNRSTSMQKKLMYYFLSIVSAIICILLIICSVTDVFSFSKQHLNQCLSMTLENSSSKIMQQFDRTNAQGIKLSSKISTEIEYLLKKNNRSFESLNNDPMQIRDLQQSMYNLLNTALESSGGSGAYVVLDVTVNTAARDSEFSRCGLYLRRTSVNDSNPVNSETALFRGMKEVARKNKLELHNRWNMEFNIKNVPYYMEMQQSTPVSVANSYLWAKKESLTDTWEKAMLLVVPIIGSQGEFYGVCGVEISELYFRLAYPSSESKFGTIVTALSPNENGNLCLSKGLCGADNRGKFSEQIFCIKPSGNFNYYTSDERKYVGLSKEISISSSPLNDTEWTVSVLLPASNFREYAVKRKVIYITVFAALLLIMIIMSVFLSRKYVQPIAKQLEAIQNGNLTHESKTGLSEIDELMNFLHTQQQNTISENTGIPEGIQEIFNNFIERTKTLTNAEYNILEYYIEGYQIMEIPDLAYISMSTVRRHNRSIYEKLEVSSRDELMLYIDLLKRCGRLDELRRNTKV